MFLNLRAISLVLYLPLTRRNTIIIQHFVKDKRNTFIFHSPNSLKGQIALLEKPSNVEKQPTNDFSFLSFPEKELRLRLQQEKLKKSR